MIGTTKPGTITAIDEIGGQQVDTDEGGRYFLLSPFDRVPGGKLGDRVILKYTRLSASMTLWVGHREANVAAARERDRQKVYDDRFQNAIEGGFSQADARLHAEQAVALFDKGDGC